MRIKIKIKNKSNNNYKFFIGGWNWKEKKTLTKWWKNYKNKDQIKKYNIL